MGQKKAHRRSHSTSTRPHTLYITPQTPATTPSTTTGSSFAKALTRAAYAHSNGAAHHDDGASAERRPAKEDHKIGMLALAALIFFSVSGGPYGMEEAIQTAGPLISLLSLVLLPLVWSVPEALASASP